MQYLFILFVCASLMMLVFMPLYIRSKVTVCHTEGFPRPVMLLLKACCTGTAVIICFLGYRFYEQIDAGLLPAQIANPFLLLGVCLSLIADVAFSIHIVFGGFMFGFAHICYCVYFILLGGFQPVSIPIFVLFLTLGLMWALPYRRYVSHVICYAAYLVVILFSFAQAFCLAFTVGVYGLIPALGMALLVASDCMLVRNQVEKRTFLSENVAHWYYFAGQLVLVSSLYLAVVTHL